MGREERGGEWKGEEERGGTLDPHNVGDRLTLLFTSETLSAICSVGTVTL